MALMLDVENGCPLFSFTSCSGGVNTIAWAPGLVPHEVRVFTGMPDGRVAWQDVVEDTKTGSITASDAHVSKGHNGAVKAFVFMNDMRTLLSVGDDGVVRLWPNDADQPTHFIKCPTGDPISSVLVVSRGNIVTVSGDLTVCLWNTSAKSRSGHISTQSSVFAARSPRRSSNGSQESPTLARGTSNSFWKKRKNATAQTVSTSQLQTSPQSASALTPTSSLPSTVSEPQESPDTEKPPEKPERPKHRRDRFTISLA